MARETPAAAPATNIVLGGYDGSLAGLNLKTDETSALTLTLKFAYSPHANAVRSAALSGSALVTGGVDETVRVYDLAKNIEVGTLLHHDGTVNALEFANDGRNLLFSAADDATVCVWRCSDWTCLKRLTGHQAPVLDLSVHPTARVALTTAKDRSLFMWNMVKGKIAFSAKTKGPPASSVQWSPDGRHYLLAAGNVVTLSNVEGRSVTKFNHEREVLCNTFLDDRRLATGGEDKIVRLWDARENRNGTVAYEHASRVRGLAHVDELVISADSGGGVKIWDIRMQGKPRLETIVANGNLRLTCMTAASSAKLTRKVDAHETEEGENAVDGSDHDPRGASKQRPRGSLEQYPEEKSRPLQGTASQRKRKKRKMRASGS